MRPTKEEIKSTYDGIATCGHSYDGQGWNSTTPIFRQLITRLKPKTIVEAGAWKGASTIHMASICRELGLDTIIYSIDCWVGPLGVRLAKTPQSHIPPHWTKPTFYQQFLYKIHCAGYSDMVIPFQAMTVPAAKVLRDWAVRPELIYVDAAHDFQSALDDMEAYWPLLPVGGVMLGDDYRSQKHVHGDRDVGAAVRKFSEDHKVSYNITNDTKDAQWWIEKAA
jgi:predicted O-methyltransferase YrrM